MIILGRWQFTSTQNSSHTFFHELLTLETNDHTLHYQSFSGYIYVDL